MFHINTSRYITQNRTNVLKWPVAVLILVLSKHILYMYTRASVLVVIL